MNQLTQELARQAFQSVNELAPEGVADYTIVDQAWFKLHNKNFAELILQECIDICQELSDDYREAGRLQRIDNENQARALFIAQQRMRAKLADM